MTEYRLFLGNPGVGKSTLVNCMLGHAEFKSGLSFGSGMTSKLQESAMRDGIVYLDTPGLADVAIREQAARAIEEGLRKGGKYKLFFVTNLKNGRVSPEDVTTFNQVVRAIKVPDLEFSVVVNNIKPRQFQMIMANKDNFDSIVVGINSMDVQTTSITLVPLLPELDEESGAITQLPPAFVAFMNQAPSVWIPRSSVQNIDVNANRFERQLNEMTAILKRLQDDNDALREKIQALERRKPGFRESLGNAFDAVVRWF